MIDLQSKIVSWSEVLANNSNLSNSDNILSYPGSALVKVREDNKIEFIVKRDAMGFSSQAREFLLKYNVEFYEEASYFNASIVYISLENIERFIPESKITPGIAYIEPNFYISLNLYPTMSTMQVTYGLYHLLGWNPHGTMNWGLMT